MATAQLEEPKAIAWTRDEFYRLVETGIFGDRRVELIDGEIIQMAAQKNFHLASVTLTADAVGAAFGAGYWPRIQGTLDLSPVFVPDPDVAVIKGSPRGCAAQNPTSALLIVEVSDTTLNYDRNVKGPLFAQAGIADYWIVNLVDRELEVYRDLQPDPAKPGKFLYADVKILGLQEELSPLAAPAGKVKVADLFP